MIHEPYRSDEAARAYVSWRGRSMARRLSKRFETWRVSRAARGAGRVLDMPCGGGRFPAFASCDRAPGMARLARQRGARAVLGDAFRLPFRTGAFDTALCVRLLHHFGPVEQREILRELRRVAANAVVTYFGTTGLKARRRQRKGSRGTRRGTDRRGFEALCALAGWKVLSDRALLPFYSEQRIVRLAAAAPSGP